MVTKTNTNTNKGIPQNNEDLIILKITPGGGIIGLLPGKK